MTRLKKNQSSKMDLSVVVPAYNEAESLPELAEWIDRVCTGSSIDYELIIIDDGSSDKTWEMVKRLSVGNNRIREFVFAAIMARRQRCRQASEPHPARW